jgi:putative tryptophan/tyrosine transport system substrate-binding protein
MATISSGRTMPRFTEGREDAVRRAGCTRVGPIRRCAAHGPCDTGGSVVETADLGSLMNRRECVGAIAAALLSVQVHAETAPGGHVPRLGLLLFNSPRTEPIGPLVQGLEAMGYVDQKTIAIEYRFADGKPERLPDLAVQLVQLKPDVIFAFGGDVAPFATRATTTIPIVAWMSNDPVESGMVTSLGRPGGNVTGITLIYDELAGKTLALLKEAVPTLARVAVLWNPDHADPEFRETKRAAATVGVRLQSIEVRRPEEFERAFRAALDERAEALVIVSSRLMSRQRQQIAEFTARNQIIVAGGWGEWTKDGALLTYGPNTSELMRRVATYVAKILKGAHPSDMPIERPTHFDLAINLKTAKAFGLTLSPALLGRADQVIS